MQDKPTKRPTSFQYIGTQSIISSQTIPEITNASRFDSSEVTFVKDHRLIKGQTGVSEADCRLHSGEHNSRLSSGDSREKARWSSSEGGSIAQSETSSANVLSAGAYQRRADPLVSRPLKALTVHYADKCTITRSGSQWISSSTIESRFSSSISFSLLLLVSFSLPC